METRRIGSLIVPVIGLGCNNFGMRLDFERSQGVIEAALEEGIVFFDTADTYGGTKSEEFLGRVLGSRRDRVFLATKFGMAIDEKRRGARPDYVLRAVEDSLRRLRTDRIDLYQLHRPDPQTPIGQTLEALATLVRSGKVREIGCSNFSAFELGQAREAAAPGAARFVSVQNEYSLLHREPEPEVLPECEREGIAFIPYFPLASGLLTGKYDEDHTASGKTRLTESGHLRDQFWNRRNRETAHHLNEFARSRGRTLLELAFSWLLARPVVRCVIAGATHPDQVRANTKAANWKLDPEDLAEIDRLTSSDGVSSGP